MVFSECKEWKIDDVETLIDCILKHTILCFALWPIGCFYTAKTDRELLPVWIKWNKSIICECSDIYERVV